MKKIRLPESVLFVLKGFCMGTADVIPGVSGGTMAFILGIYARLVNAIKSFDLIWLQGILKLDKTVIFGRPDFALILPLATGIVLALYFFPRVISLPGLMQTHPEPVYALFFGLIIGSLIVLVRQLKKITVRDYIFLIIGIVPGLICLTWFRLKHRKRAGLYF